MGFYSIRKKLEFVEIISSIKCTFLIIIDWMEVLSSEQLTSQPRSRCPRSWRSCPSRWSTRSFHFHQTQPRANFSWKFSAFSWAHFRHCCSWREFNISIMNCMVPSFDWKGTNWSGSTFDKSVMIFSCPYLMSSQSVICKGEGGHTNLYLNMDRSPPMVPMAIISSSGWKLKSLMFSCRCGISQIRMI